MPACWDPDSMSSTCDVSFPCLLWGSRGKSRQSQGEWPIYPLLLTALTWILQQWYCVLCVLSLSRVWLCDPMDCSPPGSSVHRDSPGKNTRVGCHALLQGIFSTQGSNPGLAVVLLLLLSRFSRVRLCVTPETAAHQAPPSLGFSRQEHWSGLPFPSPMHESEKWKWSRSVVTDS